LETLPYNTGLAGNRFPQATLVSAGTPVRPVPLPSAFALEGVFLVAVVHCHILNHEDRGMMAVLQIDP
jgi:hypothetical protein